MTDLSPLARAFPAHRSDTRSTGEPGKARFIDWIWTIRGTLTLPPGQSSDEAFGRLDPLFRQAGTSHDRIGDTLTFRKKGADAQDRMSIFDRGLLRIEKRASGAMLHYRLTSRALLFCLLAPLLFLGFAQATIIIRKLDTSTAAADKKKPEKKEAELPQHPIDKALGAPAPEKKKDGADKSKDDDKKPKPTAAYVLAALFAALYLVGRILEDWLGRRLFGKSLTG